ncbi:hypothetical protein N8I74_08305 [Chitiniphilus purpureus]|uniref:Hemagglutinin n=1 Tax=Chitiniphilus purpureus TaxID=2981137 RepID=A0ABY6DSJ8_9NEIS|nr:hypothetical protein [Chitiniphilus sp. CD1]UXY16997.1 hypothetical protein N8I74_08305 [Chitiniphilus sp. CD1]
MSKHCGAIFAGILTILLAGCGGGGGGGGSVPVGGGTMTPTPTPIPTAGVALKPDCAGANCGAVDGQTYAGSGIGIWRFDNTGSTGVNLPVSIAGVRGRSVTLIYTNPTAAPVAMPSIALGATQQQGDPSLPVTAPAANQLPARVRQFDPKRHLHRAEHRLLAARRAPPPVAALIGDSRDWIVTDTGDQISTRTTTLRRKLTAGDGRIVNLWVENSEYGPGKVSDAQLDRLANAFAGSGDSVYNMVTGLAGQPWGEHVQSDLIPAAQELNIVFVNFDRDGAPYGLLGYFWSVNNFIRDDNDPELQYSNEALSFFMDTETLYLVQGNTGLKVQVSTLAHEFVHMINYYQRGVLLYDDRNDTDRRNDLYYGFDTFLEESTALMMEDIVGLKLDPTYNAARDTSFPGYLANSSFNCSLTRWIGDTGSLCFSYNVAASFGAYLLRHHGIGFYQGLLRNKSSTDSVAMLDNAIRQAGGTGLADALRRWATVIALLPANGAPALHGYPERRDSGYTLPAINGPDYAHKRVLPAAAPLQLQPYAHFPLVRRPNTDRFEAVMPVPAGLSLSVVVQ